MMFFNKDDGSPNAYLKSPHATQKWVDNLPVANPSEVTRMVFEALQASNRLENTPKNRIGVLEVLYPKICESLEHLSKNYSNIVFPLSNKMQKIVENSEGILIEAARGYQQILHDFDTKKSLDKKTTALGIYRALEYLSIYFLRTVQIYAEIKTGIWKSFHALYLAAAQNSLDKIKIKATNVEQADTIEEIYKQIILLFLLTPYGLGSGQVNQLYQISLDWLRYTKLMDHIENTKERHLIFNLLVDDPPQMSAEEFHAEKMRCLVIEDLINKLEEERFQQEGSQTIKDPSKEEADQLNRLELITRAISHLTLAIKRRNPREKLQDVYAKAIVGLDNIYNGLIYITQQEKDGKKVIEEKESPAQGLDEHLFFEKDFLIHDTKASPHQDYLAHVRTEPIYRRWEVTNKSVSGCGLRWGNSEVTDIRVGKLMALQIEKEDTSWRLGVVRRMQFYKKRLEVGVEFLGSDITLINIYQIGQSIYKNGLYLPADHTLKQPERLILPTYIYKTNDKIGIKFSNKEEHVELSRILGYTSFFTIFRFKTLTRNFIMSSEDKGTF